MVMKDGEEDGSWRKTGTPLSALLCRPACNLGRLLRLAMVSLLPLYFDVGQFTALSLTPSTSPCAHTSQADETTWVLLL